MRTAKNDIQKTLLALAAKLPKLSDGRIDYSNSDKAAVLTCFMEFQGKLLLLKRSQKVRTYRGQWNTVAGYLDEIKPVRQKALQELSQELGIGEEDILHMKLGSPFEFFDESLQKDWIVCPVLAELQRKPKISLDWEHTEYR